MSSLTRILPGAGILAIAVLISGCAFGQGGTSGPLSASEVEDLVSAGVLPDDFPSQADEVRLIRGGDSIAMSWRGEALRKECTPAESTPGSIAAPLLIQDAGLTEIEKCGTFWQATQADGSHVLWNVSSSGF